MTSPYNRGSSISTGASRERIERALVDYGATDVRFSQLGHRGAIAFRGDGRQFRIVLSLPRPSGPSLASGETAEEYSLEAETKIHERASRRFWHALAVAIEAKLNAAAAGTASLESEFLAHVVLPGNRTVLEGLKPIIDSAYRSGQHPSFDVTALSRPGAGPHLSADAQYPRSNMDASAPSSSQSFQNLSALGVGRTLHRIVEILEDHGSLTHRQMLEIISDELGRDPRGE